MLPVLGDDEKEKSKNIDIRHYAKYILEEGTTEEKRELLEHLRGKIILKNKKIVLEK